MGLVKNLWRKITQTKALEQSSSKLEKDFFETIYRVTYVVGVSTIDRNIGYKLYSNLVKLMITFLICGEIWYALTEADSLDLIAPSVNVLTLQLIAVYRYNNMIYNKDFYKKLANSMGSPYFDISTEKRKRLVSFWAQKNERNLKLLLALGNCALAAWFIFPLIDELEYNLLIGICLPFDYATPIGYPVAYVLIVISFIYVAHFVMVTAFVTQAHLIHLLCQYSVLADCFENLVDDCSFGFEGISIDELIVNKEFADKYKERLGNLVEQHKLILSNTMHLRNISSGALLGQLAASFTIICFIAYQTASTGGESLVKSLMCFLFLSYNIFELYVVCHWCEEITIWSKNIGEAVYSSGWENGLCKIPGVRATILFIIARANKPLVFTAGGMYDISVAAFGSLLKASYSALTVLLRSRHEKI